MDFEQYILSAWMLLGKKAAGKLLIKMHLAIQMDNWYE